MSLGTGVPALGALVMSTPVAAVFGATLAAPHVARRCCPMPAHSLAATGWSFARRESPPAAPSPAAAAARHRMVLVRAHAAAAGALATLFWLWAAYNCLTRHFDLGVLSFLSVIYASRWVPHSPSFVPCPPLRARFPLPVAACPLALLTGGASCFVSLNYALGLFVVSGDMATVALLTYFTLSALLWAVSGALGAVWARRCQGQGWVLE
eukprot:gene11362-2069_t